MNKRIFGFTLAEVMVTLMVVGVVAGITIPILFDVKADKDTQVYRKALYTLQRGAYNFMNGTGYLKLQKDVPNYNEADYLENFTNRQICQALAEEMNTQGYLENDDDTSHDIDCSHNSGCNNDGENCLTPNFITTDGIGFYNLGGEDKFSEKNIFVKLVDEKNSETEARKNKGGSDMLRININRRGKFSVRESWEYEQSLIESYTKIKN